MSDAVLLPCPLAAALPGAAPPPRSRAVDRAIAYIHGHFAERISLDDLAAIAGLSVFRFLTVFKAQVGLPPHRYLSQVRVARAQALLLDGMAPASVAMEVGFFDQSHLCRNFKTICGQTPGQYLTSARRRRIAQGVALVSDATVENGRSPQ